MKHPALAHLDKRARWRWLQRYNAGWGASLGFLLFIAVGGVMMFISAVLMVRLGVTNALQAHAASELAGPITWAIGLACGAGVWEGVRRVMINRALNAAPSLRHCPCGYDLSGVEQPRCPECGAEREGSRA